MGTSRFMVPSPRPPKVTANLKSKNFSLKQTNKSNTFSYYRKKTNFVSSRKQPMVPLDKRLQWENVDEKPFRQI